MGKQVNGVFWELVQRFERLLLQAALDAHDGNLSRAADAIQLDRIVFIRKAEAYRVRRNRQLGRPPGRPRRRGHRGDTLGARR